MSDAVAVCCTGIDPVEKISFKNGKSKIRVEGQIQETYYMCIWITKRYLDQHKAVESTKDGNYRVNR